MNSPILSIVIASKNRIPYCINAIETILKYPNKNFELVVQDNSDTKELSRYILDNISDSRLVYNYTPPPFSSIDNFNASIKLTTGEYVCLIGDDDGICPQIFEVVEWASKNKIESICPKTFCEFIWPNSLANNNDSKLVVPNSTGLIFPSDPSKILTQFFKQGALDYLPMGFPKIYHGIVKKECLQRIEEKTGYFFGGLSPDIYAAIALACVVDNHVLIDYPLTIAGACNQSATIASLKGQHSGDLKNAPHFRDRGNYIWDSLIPPIYSIETIWAESALKALTDMGRMDLRLKFNSNLFIVKNILRNTDKFKYFLTKTFKYLISSKKGILTFFKLAILMLYLILIFLSKFFLVKRKVNKENIIFSEVLNIEEATLLASKTLNERRINYNLQK